MNFSTYVMQPAVNDMINKVIVSKARASRLISSLISSVNGSKQLVECDPKEILYAAFYGETLGLYPLPQLGHYFIVPYYDRSQGKYRAAFQLGYKGMIQLAIKTNHYKFINCTPLKVGELKKWDGINEEIIVEYISDQEVRSSLKTIGFAGGFKLTNGFEKKVYWTKDQVEQHANKFSSAYTSGKSKFWTENFDAMGRKTVLRALLLNWGVLSPDLGDILADPTNIKVVSEDDITIKEDSKCLENSVPQE